MSVEVFYEIIYTILRVNMRSPSSFSQPGHRPGAKTCRFINVFTYSLSEYLMVEVSVRCFKASRTCVRGVK